MVVVVRSSDERMLDHGVRRNMRKFVGISVLPKLTLVKMLMCRGLCIKRLEHTRKCVVWAHANKKSMSKVRQTLF